MRLLYSLLALHLAFSIGFAANREEAGFLCSRALKEQGLLDIPRAEIGALLTRIFKLDSKTAMPADAVKPVFITPWGSRLTGPLDILEGYPERLRRRVRARAQRMRLYLAQSLPEALVAKVGIEKVSNFLRSAPKGKGKSLVTLVSESLNMSNIYTFVFWGETLANDNFSALFFWDDEGEGENPQPVLIIHQEQNSVTSQ